MKNIAMYDNYNVHVVHLLFGCQRILSFREIPTKTQLFILFLGILEVYKNFSSMSMIWTSNCFNFMMVSLILFHRAYFLWKYHIWYFMQKLWCWISLAWSIIYDTKSVLNSDLFYLQLDGKEYINWGTD